MHRLPDELLRGTEFDHAPEVHYAYAPFPREVLGDGEVVGDEQKSHPELPLQPQQHVEQPDAQRDVHHRDRLVGHDELGVDGKRSGDGDALPLPPESWWGYFFKKSSGGVSPTVSSNSWSLLCSSERVFASLWRCKGALRICVTLRIGFNEA